MEEKWVNIHNYEGYYQLSCSGKVRSLDRYITDKRKTQFIKGKVLKPFNNGKGYMVVSLLKDGKRKNHYVHRLVAEHFIDDFVIDKVVNHKNFNKQDCKVENLNMMTQKENIIYSKERGRYVESNIKNAKNRHEKALKRVLEHSNDILQRYDNGESILIISKSLHLKERNVRDYIMSKRCIKIICIETGEMFDTIQEANKKYNVTTIKDAINGKQKTSAGLHWIRKIIKK